MGTLHVLRNLYVQYWSIFFLFDPMLISFRSWSEKMIYLSLVTLQIWGQILLSIYVQSNPYHLRMCKNPQQ